MPDISSLRFPARMARTAALWNARAAGPSFGQLLLFAFAATLLLTRAVQASPQGSIQVSAAWARATPPGISVGAAYLLIRNAGAADNLIRVDCPLAERVEMHSSTLVGGVMHMRPVTDLLLPAHGELRFAPESLHLMLLGLKSPLVAGEHVPLVLTFKSGVHVSADAVVRGLSEGGPSE